MPTEPTAAPSTPDREELVYARDALRDRGFAVIPAIVAGERLHGLRAEANFLIREFTESGYRSPDFWHFTPTSSGNDVLYRIHNLERQGAARTADLFRSGPLHTLASHLLGTRAEARVCALVVKMPLHAAAVPWHRDRTDTPAGTACNLSLFLDPSTPDNGCLEFAERSHLCEPEISVDEIREHCPAKLVGALAGDVVAHDVRIAHSSRPNTSARIRRSIVIEFVATRQESR